MPRISAKTLDREWRGRPETVLRFFKRKYGTTAMKRITSKVLGNK